MATAPMAPSGGPKSFWDSPEKWTTLAFLVVAGGVALYFWGVIVPFILSMLVDTFHTILLAIGILALTSPVWSKKVRWIIRLIMRQLTGMVINIDPIGILEDQLLEMKKKQAEMNDQIGRVSGSKQMLEDIIAKNKVTAMRSMKLAEEAKKESAAAKDENERMRKNLQMRTQANQAGRLQQSNDNYEKLLSKITNLYNMLTKWATNIQFFVEDTENQVKEAKVQKKVVDAASSAFQKAMAIFRGSPEEQDIWDRTMEHLADEASMKLGQINDFQRMAQGFMDKIDIQNGAVEADALAALDKYEQKMLTSGDQSTAFLLQGNQAKAVGQPASGYDDIFSK